MAPLVLFLILCVISGALLVAGSYVLAGLGAALLAAAGCSAAAAWFMRKGMTVE